MAKELDYMEYANDAAAQSAYPSSDKGNSGVFDSYSESNYDYTRNVGAGDITAGQAIAIQVPLSITSCKFYLKRTGSISGNCYAKIYACSGTPGTDGIISGSALATSDAIDASTLGTDYALVEFTFSTPYSASPGNYCIVVYYDSAFSLQLGFDNSSPTHAGNMCYGDGYSASRDCCFYLYGNWDNLECYSEDTIKEQGSYSLKVIARQTESLNDTLTRTVNPTIDLSGINTLKLYVYASRTGTNISVSIHDSGGTTTTKTITIASANTWTEITWDISEVANADKDAIDQIVIKITNADTTNTFYVDNFFGVEIQAYPIARLNKNRISGYHCFVDAYLRASREGLTPLKLPDGTVF